jgi:hypothetical protein
MPATKAAEAHSILKRYRSRASARRPQGLSFRDRSNVTLQRRQRQFAQTHGFFSLVLRCNR